MLATNYCLGDIISTVPRVLSKKQNKKPPLEIWESCTEFS